MSGDPPGWWETGDPEPSQTIEVPPDTLQRMAAVVNFCINRYPGVIKPWVIKALTPDDLQHIERLAKGDCQ